MILLFGRSDLIEKNGVRVMKTWLIEFSHPPWWRSRWEWTSVPKFNCVPRDGVLLDGVNGNIYLCCRIPRNVGSTISGSLKIPNFYLVLLGETRDDWNTEIGLPKISAPLSPFVIYSHAKFLARRRLWRARDNISATWESHQYFYRKIYAKYSYLHQLTWKTQPWPIMTTTESTERPISCRLECILTGLLTIRNEELFFRAQKRSGGVYWFSSENLQPRQLAIFEN